MNRIDYGNLHLDICHVIIPIAFLINRMIRCPWYSQEWFWRSGRTVRYCRVGTSSEWRTPNNSHEDGTTWTIWNKIWTKSFNQSTESSWPSWFTRFWHSGQDYKNNHVVTWRSQNSSVTLVIFYNLGRIFLSRVQTQVHTTAHLQILQIHLHLRNILPTNAALIHPISD